MYKSHLSRSRKPSQSLTYRPENTIIMIHQNAAVTIILVLVSNTTDPKATLSNIQDQDVVKPEATMLLQLRRRRFKSHTASPTVKYSRLSSDFEVFFLESRCVHAELITLTTHFHSTSHSMYVCKCRGAASKCTSLTDSSSETVRSTLL